MTAAAVLLAAALLVTPAPARTRLAGAQRAWKPSAWTVRAAAVPVVLGAALLLPATVLLAAALLAITLFARRRAAAVRRRRSAESAALRDGLDMVAGELRAGAHPVSAFGAAGAELGGDVGERLLMVAARGRLGADVATGLRAVAARSPLPDSWERLAVCWQLAATHGLAIATLMRAAQHDIVERDRFRARVDAGLAGARTTAAVLAGMPVLGIALGQLIGADPLGFLFSGGPGGVLLVIGIALSCLGLYWSDRIVAGLPI
ncbi:type II secretion system F family protein [Mycobacterium sp. AMU20-3851]|uniref:type II secretion system F family protein n=1 Tax=Mycobacterium sp. AMU20-3851 TaxID=3122055 RepID=UPI003755057D